ncbi:MAG: hypothetical protein FWE70_01845 [Oscillospiraceae bacterium]|nr:hypothetical protein [Oscillospiraceae bacterium]
MYVGKLLSDGVAREQITAINFEDADNEPLTERKALHEHIKGRLVPDSICNSVIMKDVVRRRRIPDVTTLEGVIRFMFDNIGNLSSAKGISDALTVRDPHMLGRELRSLDAIKDYYPKSLLTLDEDPPASHNGIWQMNALDWLMGQG